MLHALGTLGIWLMILGGGTMVWLGFKQPRSRTTILLGIALLGGGLIVKANRAPAIPRGLNSRSAIIKKALRSSKLSYEPRMSEVLGFSDMTDDDQIQLMENPKTKRYVFNYDFKGQIIPVYVIYSRIDSKKERYNAYLIPVNDDKIENLLTDGVVADKQVKAKSYYGFSYQDLEQLMPEDAFNGSKYPEPKIVGKYVVTDK